MAAALLLILDCLSFFGDGGESAPNGTKLSGLPFFFELELCWGALSFGSFLDRIGGHVLVVSHEACVFGVGKQKK